MDRKRLIRSPLLWVAVIFVAYLLYSYLSDDTRNYKVEPTSVALAQLSSGNVSNAVNFPQVSMPRESAYRLAIANANVPNMLGQISTAMAQAGLNIHNMVNKSRGGMAYTLVDVDSPVTPEVQAGIAAIHGVLAVRYLPAA